MTRTELCVIHPGGLSAACWGRVASHLPPATPVQVLELDTIMQYWSGDPGLTVDLLAERLLPRLGPADAPRVLVGWGAGGVVADALAAPSRRVVVLDGLAPGALASELAEPQLLRSFAMYAGARRGRLLQIEPARLHAGLEAGLEHIRQAASASGAPTTPSAIRRCYEDHADRVVRDHRLITTATPSGRPLTVVKAARSLAPDSPALGWDRFGLVERLASGGDHYSMLTEPAPAVHLAMLLRRWLAPVYSVAA